MQYAGLLLPTEVNLACVVQDPCTRIRTRTFSLPPLVCRQQNTFCFVAPPVVKARRRHAAIMGAIFLPKVDIYVSPRMLLAERFISCYIRH